MKQIMVIMCSLLLSLTAQAEVLTYKLDTHNWAQNTTPLCHANSPGTCVVDPDRWHLFIPSPTPLASVALKPDTFKSTAYQRAALDRYFQPPSLNHYAFLATMQLAPNPHHQWHVERIAVARPQQSNVLCSLLQVENPCHQSAYSVSKSLATSQVSAPLLAMLMIPVLVVSFYRRESAPGIR